MMAKAESPRPRGLGGYDSPGRRINDTRAVEDLERALRAFKVADSERTRLYAEERRRHNEDVDLHETLRENEDNGKIQLAASHREKLRQEAESVLRDFYQKQEDERRRREEEQRRLEEEQRRQEEEKRRQEEEERLRLQREAQQKAERDRQIAEEKERLRKAEEDRRQAEQQRLAQEKEQARLAEADKQQKAEEQRKAAEEQKKSENARQIAAEQEAQKASADSPEALHQEYITLYFNLKTWSNNYWDELRNASKSQRNPSIKEEIGETRRLIKSEIGKLSSHDKEINRMASDKLKTAFRSLLQKTTPVIGKNLPINNFLPPSLHLPNDNNQSTITDMAAYFLIFLTKQVIKIFTSYVHSGPERAEPIGVVLSSIFAMPEIQYTRPDQPNHPPNSRQNLFPIFLAKYHRVCPVLFGVTAPPGHSQSTSHGKRTLGWQLAPAAEEGDQKTTFVSEQTHYDRMKGLAIGYSSIALRNFSGVTMPNPYPPKHFWKSLAMIVNLPVDKVSPTHVCVLRYMFGHGGVGRFLLFFGSVGVAVLREAFLEFPRRLPEEMKKDYYVKDLMFWAENVVGDKEHLHLT